MRAAILNRAPGDPDALDVLLLERPSWPAPVSVAGFLRRGRWSGRRRRSPTPTCVPLRPQKLRTYSISNAPAAAADGDSDGADVVELTVTRQAFAAEHDGAGSQPGVGSGFLNPPKSSSAPGPAEEVMVGLQQPAQFSLPSIHRPVVLPAAGSGIGPFRAFLQAREAEAAARGLRGESWLLYGCRDEASLLYREEWHAMLRRGTLNSACTSPSAASRTSAWSPTRPRG